MAKINTEIESFARIKVIGVGGSGKNAINHMVNSKLKGVEFIAVNTDTQDLHHSLAEKKIHIGRNLTRGLGAGMDPEIGKRSAEETREEIQDSIKGADMVFIACGMGGGTGTGAAPVIAGTAKNEGILTVAIVTKPFFFEGNQRMRLAEAGIAELEKEVDALIVIPNDRVLSIIDKNTTVNQAFAMCDEILKQAVEGIADIIRSAGDLNLDFADIKRVIKDSGTALIGIGHGAGESRAVDAAMQAINSPLLDVSLHGAKSLLYAIYGGEDLGMLEVAEASKIITESVDKEAKIIFGIIKDESLKKDEIKITVIATGFPTSFNTRVKDDKETVAEAMQRAREERERAEREKERERELQERERQLAEPRIPREETVKDMINNVEQTPRQSGRIDNSLVERQVAEETVKTPEKKSPFKFDEDDEEDDWDALPVFLKRTKK